MGKAKVKRGGETLAGMWEGWLAKNLETREGLERCGFSVVCLTQRCRLDRNATRV